MKGGLMVAALAFAAVLRLFGDPESPVTVDFENTSLADVLRQLTTLTEVPIELDAAARKKLGDPEKLMVAFKVKDVALTDALKLLLGPHGLSVKVVDRKKVVVTVK
ncbi:MAG: hypothetical protein EHM91_15540 [Planctomycetota bacterium]|nr:MAG: hypothetical protein EHM91_15540 [Planctomycetota bacterium]